ncbi:hypothetical protein IWQ60_002327 [Tieghemiomyces parasiticus]|uniref:AAA+ ATPase domain-containing protein n=1 Tax=Tieghemiomyces parasiticus TaxID=78921 RepID=A0A9W8E150_9FUNG|nr:hypothetical protein IWQ60_002327 [Tieghemiomyces parasiticus]
MYARQGRKNRQSLHPRQPLQPLKLSVNLVVFPATRMTELWPLGPGLSSAPAVQASPKPRFTHTLCDDAGATVDADTILLTVDQVEYLWPSKADRPSASSSLPSVYVSLTPRLSIPRCRTVTLRATARDQRLSGLPEHRPTWLHNCLISPGYAISTRVSRTTTLRFEIAHVVAASGTPSDLSLPWCRIDRATAVHVEVRSEPTPPVPNGPAKALFQRQTNGVSDPKPNDTLDHSQERMRLALLLEGLGSGASHLYHLWRASQRAHRDPGEDNMTAPTAVLLTGPSGAGKSLLLHELARLKTAARWTDCTLYPLDLGQLVQSNPGNLGDTLRSVLRGTRQPRADGGLTIVAFENIHLFFPTHGSDPDLLLLTRRELQRLQPQDKTHPSEIGETPRDPPAAQGFVVATAPAPHRVASDLRVAFTDHVTLTTPTRDERRALIRYALGLYHDKLPEAYCRPVEYLVDLSPGYLAADIFHLCRNVLDAVPSKGTSDAGSYISERLPEVTETLVRATVRGICPSLLSASLVAGGSAATTPSVQALGSAAADSRVHWADVGGLVEVKRILEETILWLGRQDAAYRRLGISPRKGVLLHGPPGTGKTLLAKAVATESRANFLPVSIPALIKGEVGESEKAVANFFRLARQTSPCVLFIDELEVLFGSKDTSGLLGKNLISQFLLEMDRLNAEDRRVVILAATNLPQAIDPSILRPGRLDIQVYVPPPTAVDRLAILQLQARKLRLATDVNLAALAADGATQGLTGADLQGVLNAAGLLALQRAWSESGLSEGDIQEIVEAAAITQCDLEAAVVNFRHRVRAD